MSAFHPFRTSRLKIPFLMVAALGLAPIGEARAAGEPLAVEGSKTALPVAKPQPAVPAAAAKPASVLSEPATRLLSWINATRDNQTYPYMVVDKTSARLFLFDAKGKLVGDAPVLIGIAVGDDSTPGIGKKKLAEIGPAERTTPAGRYFAKIGSAVGMQRVLWIDKHVSVALHAVVTTNKKERRLERLRTSTAEDNRVTFGCINVATTFYNKQIRTLFQKAGGVVYILPDTKKLDDVFPLVRTMASTQAQAS